MKNGLTEIIFLLDQSGSMECSKHDAIKGFNKFLEEQQSLDGEARLTVAFFDHRYDVYASNKDIKEVKPINIEVYKPSGSTALYDAVGDTIEDVGVRLNNTAEELKPEKVVIVILTDGAENSSVRYTSEKIKCMIEHQTSIYKWEFIYLGANQDTMLSASSLGINNFTSYYSNSKGFANVYSTVSSSVSSYRTSGYMTPVSSTEVKDVQ